ncbi:hypothetical protein [Chitinimonas sp.]|uniref:hypothetical protein n=1 Tax=Chitinimonas sp. TaxID=1934313 RepID=UPI002F950ED3
MKILSIALLLFISPSLLQAASAVDAVDDAAATKLLEDNRQRAEAGDMKAQAWLGNYYLSKQMPADLALAEKWFTAAAEQGDVRAMAWLGVHYDETGSRDLALAYRWYQKAASAGSIYGQFQVAQMQEIGRGTDVQLAAALSSYSALADNGHAGALFRLGMLHEFGVGVVRNPEVATCYYERAKQRESLSAEMRVTLSQLAPPSANKSCDAILSKAQLAQKESARKLPASQPAQAPRLVAQTSPNVPCTNISQMGSKLSDRFLVVAAKDEIEKAAALAQVTIGTNGQIEYVEVLQQFPRSRLLTNLITQSLYGLACTGNGVRVLKNYPLVFSMLDDEPALTDGVSLTTDGPAVTIDIDAQEGVSINGSAMQNEAAWYAQLKQLAAEAPARTFNLRVAGAIPYEVSGRVVERLQRVGARGINFILDKDQVFMPLKLTAKAKANMFGVPVHKVDVHFDDSIFFDGVQLDGVGAFSAKLRKMAAEGHAYPIHLRPNKDASFKAVADVLLVLQAQKAKYPEVYFIGAEQFY